MTEQEKREMILNDNLWKVIFRISIPLVLFHAMNTIFKIFDAFLAASFGAIEVSAVVFVHQIKLLFESIGHGLSLGGSILVARAFGAHKNKKAANLAGNLYTLSFFLASLMILLALLAEPILKLANSPVELMPVAKNFLSIQMITSAIMMLNFTFIGLEKAKGQSKRIMYLNIFVMIIKLGLSLFFVYILKTNVLMLAVATLFAQGSLFIISLNYLTRPSNPIRINKEMLFPKKKWLFSIFKISLPITIEKASFSFGKVWVSALSGLYGSTVVGALGISNQVSGFITMIGMGFKDGQLTIISQNLGNKNQQRALGTFYRAFIINLGVGLIGFSIMTLFIDPIISFFSPDNPGFGQTIHSVLYYERIAYVALTTSHAIFALFYGFRLTRVVLIANTLRLFLFRIPPLYLLQKLTDWGSKSVGISMMISNLMVGLSAFIFLFLYRKHFWHSNKLKLESR